MDAEYIGKYIKIVKDSLAVSSRERKLISLW